MGCLHMLGIIFEFQLLMKLFILSWKSKFQNETCIYFITAFLYESSIEKNEKKPSNCF